MTPRPSGGNPASPFGLLAREGPAILLSLGVTEWFLKLGSFTLELMGFLLLLGTTRTAYHWLLGRSTGNQATGADVAVEEPTKRTSTPAEDKRS